jgi:hypothetical protein
MNGATISGCTVSGSKTGILLTDRYLGDIDTFNENFFGNLYFYRQFAFQPWTVTNITSGETVASVVEIGKGEALEGNLSHYSILDTGGEMTYPWYKWAKLLRVLKSL